ncbi:MAG TPA: hypothetical protein VHN11_07815 [Xanthobacteraceae bacterium]|jgi:hypothetical protein|nr:hypothetical protein [Xanthobacteraceae bacterium]
MLACWRTGGANDPETFITAVAAILARYPDEVVYAVTNPTEGLPVQLTWMPSVKEVHDACEKEMEPIYRRQREEKVIADLMESRKQDEIAREHRPTVEELKAKFGENWGMKSLDKPERKTKPAPTADELREHYSKFKLAFQPKEAE